MLHSSLVGCLVVGEPGGGGIGEGATTETLKRSARAGLLFVLFWLFVLIVIQHA